MAKSRYTPVDNGYFISGSSELFNRTLYGSHQNDDQSARFFTFAGDAPQFMGATTDWKENLVSFYAKRGTLTSGLALTPDQRVGFFYSEDMDISSRWFHNSEDVAATFKNGWMEYELSQMSPWFPDVDVRIEAYPLLPDDGFLVRYKIKTDQRVFFVAGFGGLTDYIGRFEYKDEQKRYFHASDCETNEVKIGKNRASIRRANACEMRIGSSFDAEFSIGSAKALETPYPSTFLGSQTENTDDQAVKISAVIEPDKTLDGYLVVLYNAEEKTLEKWLTMQDPVKYVKGQILQKHARVNVKTPDPMLDLTVAPTVIALDASYHKNSFHHGAFGYHSPFLGWRNWYAPTVLGWKERVESVMAAHLGQIVKASNGEERVWFDGAHPREGEENDPSPYHAIENSTGYLPYLLGENAAYYNMQECAFDMMLHHIEWTGNLAIAEKYFDEFCAMLDWEERILDPDGDGLYQNFLNTWISDGHSYNGAGCAQASAYNYRANLAMAKIAKKLGKASERFTLRAEKIKTAAQEKLWLANEGIIAESVDTVGNKLVHPCPELSTVYLAIDCGLVVGLQAYTLLKYTENYIKSVQTPCRGGRLSYSSSWLPKKYSTYGIFPAENAHLALAYFKTGLKEEGNKLLDGLVDCYFTGRNPGMAAHVQSSKGTADLADLDFTDVSSTYLRLVAEGLFGVSFGALDGTVTLAPNFPDEWENASLTLDDISLHYTRKGSEEVFESYCERTDKKRFKIPMRSTTVESVLLNGEPIAYAIEPAPNNSFITVETEKTGRLTLRIVHGDGRKPTLRYAELSVGGNEIVFQVENGEILSWNDLNGTLENIRSANGKIYAKTKKLVGKHTLFVRVKKDEYDGYLAADYEIVEEEKTEKPETVGGRYETIDISKLFNASLTEIHKQKYMSPRPEGYSIGVFDNGRYAWEWNHGGHNRLVVDDTALRESGGEVYTRSGIPFATPKTGKNVACASVWDNFPTKISIPLFGAGKELATLFVSTTNAMQTGVENARFTVEYEDGTSEEASLVYPRNIDDWLVPALQRENEIFYFNDYNHATVQTLRLQPEKRLVSLTVEGIANEVIVGVLGVTIRR